jgi:hypothetical protein
MAVSRQFRGFVREGGEIIPVWVAFSDDRAISLSYLKGERHSG